MPEQNRIWITETSLQATDVISLYLWLVMKEALTGMLTLRDPPCTPRNSMQKQSSSAEARGPRDEE